MAIFEGTVQEFHDFIGPKIRNAVNNLTRSYRKKLNGICEECGKEKELHSAHVHGRGRRDIIEAVLSEYSQNGTIRCDIKEAENKILNAHQPIESYFRFLCHPCHVQYDKKENTPQETIDGSTPGGFKKISRIKRWAERPDQDNHKIISAFLRLEAEANGGVLLSKLQQLCANKTDFPQYYVAKFNGHYPSMKTDGGNSHGKVFCDKDGIVHIWPKVREEIRKYFGK